MSSACSDRPPRIHPSLFIVIGWAAWDAVGGRIRTGWDIDETRCSTTSDRGGMLCPPGRHYYGARLGAESGGDGVTVRLMPPL